MDLALKIAERVVGQANHEHPADAVLRQALKSERRLSPETSTTAAHAVFAYFRWIKWLPTQAPLRDRIEQGIELAKRYAREPQSFSDADLLTHAVPVWIASELDVTPGWIRALQAEPRLWLRARRSQGTALAKRLRKARTFGPGPLADALEYFGREDLFQRPEFHAGEFEVQDLSSQAVGLVCAPEPGETWWDACAGEGGKLLHLSNLMQNRGLIWASDRAAWRLQRLKRRAARGKVFNYRTAPWDGGPKLPTRTKFDGVLIDAPCSGVGTWQRNPHARWTLSPKDVRELAELQKQLLAHASISVKPGGKLVYAVCTLTRSETAEIADMFERSRPDFVPLGISHPLKTPAAEVRRLQLWPQDFGSNGMFIAVWRRQQ